jgi:protein transport protein SEC13
MATTTASTAIAAPTEASSAPIYIDTQHEDLVHDAQMDYYGAKLATCSSDRTIKVYNVSDSAYELSATLQGHEGPVWQVSWAHPKFGVVLASCSFDGSVLIHRESRPREWTMLHAARQLHDSSINGVAFAPHEYGLQLATASSDGNVSVLQHQPNNTWAVEYLTDCPMGVNAVSWAPYGAYYDPSAASPTDQVQEPRLVTAGCDNAIRFWKCQDGTTWVPDEAKLDTAHQHSDWVRDVAWAPSLLPNHNIVASCAEDKTVLIWKQEGLGQDWKPTLLHQFEAPVWRVSWSVTGLLLAVSSGDSDVTLWKAGLDGQWTQVSTVEDTPPEPST